ncbi:hypothetical protein [Jannaschia sp. M317]|uniref:hypothetical protein n=1 Tax=Jannaschia sp. M317 TaxID=2867011 RepID=UPI0021A5CCCD|nr:hypothetical protein [Jannaschia sp. M317]UWQ18176.1 hypothetical protein K3551_02380 [Jannaschia sp. M317]
MKTAIAALVLSVAALPVLADQITINDDGWARIPSPPVAMTTVDIDDDGWTRVDMTSIRSDRAPVGNSGECTALESSVGLRADACGVLNLNELATLAADND